MALYRNVVVPALCHLAMRNPRLVAYRKRIAGVAEGRVLEIGVGSGLNIPLYRFPVCEVVGLEPSPRLLAMARRRLGEAVVPVTLIEASAEAIPLEDDSVDTVVTSWTLCSIPQAVTALGEVRRVLRAHGRLLFVEHGLAPEKGVRRWQDRLTPAWKRLSGGCHLNRPIARLIEESGFRVDWLQMGYIPGPKPLTFMYEGSARRR